MSPSPKIDKSSISINTLTWRPVELPKLWIQIEKRVVKALIDTEEGDTAKEFSI